MIRIGRVIQFLPYAGFLFRKLPLAQSSFLQPSRFFPNIIYRHSDMYWTKLFYIYLIKPVRSGKAAALLKRTKQSVRTWIVKPGRPTQVDPAFCSSILEFYKSIQ